MIDGKALAAKVREEVAAEIEELGEVGLTTVLVGDDPASHVYISGKHKAATSVGIHANDLRLPADTPQDELLQLLAELNADDAVDGILVQLPLPSHLDEAKVIEAIDPAKDIDGLHPLNAGHLYLGRPKLVPGTPLGIMRMLAEYDIETTGARAVVIGRSAIVGKPMAHLLLQANATVTICHSRTVDLRAAHAGRRHPRRSRGAASHRGGGHGAGRCDGDRRRHEPDRGRALRRRRPERRRARGLHDAGPRRRRADDDRHGLEEHGHRGEDAARPCFRSFLR